MKNLIIQNLFDHFWFDINMSLFSLCCSTTNNPITPIVSLLEVVRDDFVTAMTTSDLNASEWVSEWYSIQSKTLCSEIQAAIVTVFPPFVHHLISFETSTLLGKTKVQFVIEFDCREGDAADKDEHVRFPAPPGDSDVETTLAQYIRDIYIESMCWMPFRKDLKKKSDSIAFQFLDGVTKEGVEIRLRKLIPHKNIQLSTHARCQATEILYKPYGVNVAQYAPGWKAAPPVACNKCRTLYPTSYDNAIKYLIIDFRHPAY